METDTEDPSSVGAHCKLCEKKFNNHKDLVEHLYKHAPTNLTCSGSEESEEENFKCKKCHLKFRDVDQGRIHVLKHHSYELKNEASKLDSSVKQNKVKMNVKLPISQSFLCTLCSTVFTSKYFAKIHRYKKHSENRNQKIIYEVDIIPKSNDNKSKNNIFPVQKKLRSQEDIPTFDYDKYLIKKTKSQSGETRQSILRKKSLIEEAQKLKDKVSNKENRKRNSNDIEAAKIKQKRIKTCAETLHNTHCEELVSNICISWFPTLTSTHSHAYERIISFPKISHNVVTNVRNINEDLRSDKLRQKMNQLEIDRKLGIDKPEDDFQNLQKDSESDDTSVVSSGLSPAVTSKKGMPYLTMNTKNIKKNGTKIVSSKSKSETLSLHCITCNNTEERKEAICKVSKKKGQVNRLTQSIDAQKPSTSSSGCAQNKQKGTDLSKFKPKGDQGKQREIDMSKDNKSKDKSIEQKQPPHSKPKVANTPEKYSETIEEKKNNLNKPVFQPTQDKTKQKNTISSEKKTNLSQLKTTLNKNAHKIPLKSTDANKKTADNLKKNKTIGDNKKISDGLQSSNNKTSSNFKEDIFKGADANLPHERGTQILNLGQGFNLLDSVRNQMGPIKPNIEGTDVIVAPKVPDVILTPTYITPAQSINHINHTVIQAPTPHNHVFHNMQVVKDAGAKTSLTSTKSLSYNANFYHSYKTVNTPTSVNISPKNWNNNLNKAKTHAMSKPRRSDSRHNHKIYRSDRDGNKTYKFQSSDRGHRIDDHRKSQYRYEYYRNERRHVRSYGSNRSSHSGSKRNSYDMHKKRKVHFFKCTRCRIYFLNEIDCERHLLKHPSPEHWKSLYKECAICFIKIDYVRFDNHKKFHYDNKYDKIFVNVTECSLDKYGRYKEINTYVMNLEVYNESKSGKIQSIIETDGKEINFKTNDKEDTRIVLIAQSKTAFNTEPISQPHDVQKQVNAIEKKNNNNALATKNVIVNSTDVSLHIRAKGQDINHEIYIKDVLENPTEIKHKTVDSEDTTITIEPPNLEDEDVLHLDDLSKSQIRAELVKPRDEGNKPTHCDKNCLENESGLLTVNSNCGNGAMKNKVDDNTDSFVHTTKGAVDSTKKRILKRFYLQRSITEK